MRVIITLLLILYMPLSNAGALSKILMEIFEGTVKNIDLEKTTPIITRTVKPALRSININSSVEDKVKFIIYTETDYCNTYNYDKYISFIKTYTYVDSPAWKDLLSEDVLYFYKNYKFTCHLKEVNFINHGISGNDVDNFAYATVSQSGSIPGILSGDIKSMYVFKLDGDIWKLWDTVIFEEKINHAQESWWFYDKSKDMCIAIEQDSKYFPMNLIGNNMALDCSSKGL